MIERHDGQLFYSRNMGKRNLAYRIKKQIKGLYYDVCYAAESDCVADIERFLRIDENVLRFLTVLKAEKVDVEARLAEIEARGEGLAEEVDEEILIEQKTEESNPESSELEATEAEEQKEEKEE